jgi:hypothetical protein
MTAPFPTNISFIDEGRKLEAEAFDRGRRSNQISMRVLVSEGPFDGMPSEDDIQETEERLATLKQYVPYAQEAFRDRGLVYPFQTATDENSLTPLEGNEDLARRCAELSDLVGRDNSEGRLAKGFETRAVRALHKFIGGWAVSVGSPRADRSGPRAAVERFRNMLQTDKGDYQPAQYPPAGDLGADAIWILGREWAGPIIYLQAKNSAFSIRAIPPEFHRARDILYEWFGRRMDSRALINVFAVNTILTRELKESGFLAGGIHLLDAADILTAESLPDNYQMVRDTLALM